MEQTDPVLPIEFLLRRVPYNENNKLIDLDLPQPVAVGAFNPAPNDVDGISVYREYFVTPDQVAREYMESKPGKICWVVRIRARDLFKDPINVRVIPAPINSGLPGHALIPELNTVVQNKKGSERDRFTELRKEIARLVTRDDIAYWPQE